MSAQTIRLAFSGDFAPLVQAPEAGAAHFGELDAILKSADAHVTNLECPLTSAGTPILKTGPVLKAPSAAIGSLLDAKVTVACLANNHIFDYGEAGLRETIDACEKNGIATVGVVNRPDGREPWLVKEIKGKKICLLNWCEHEFSLRGQGEIGANGVDPIIVFNEIKTLRPQVDLIIVIYHGGNEYYPLPRPGMKRIFHFFVDLGADAVIAHHSHAISGYEVYNGKPLVYGLGNFFFPYEGESREWYTGLLCLLTIAEAVQVELIPIQQSRMGLAVKRLGGDEKTWIMSEIDHLSQTILDDRELLRQWNMYARTSQHALQRQMPGIGRIERVMLKMGFPLKRILSRRSLLSALNRTRCQAHHDLMTTFMEELLK